MAEHQTVSAGQRIAGVPVARAILLLVAGLLVAHIAVVFSVQGSGCIDDAYISFCYARNLVAGHGLVFNVGEKVEGYTNFGWVMVLAVAEAAKLDLPVVARFVNIALGLVLVWLTCGFLARRIERSAITALLLVGGLLATDGALVRWSQDGLETVLFALLVFAGASSTVIDMERARNRPWSGLWFAAAALVRPEGVVFVAATIGFAFLRPGSWRQRLTRTAITGGAFALVFVPYFWWRWSYFGFLLPNTFYAKVGWSLAQAERGVAYLAQFFLVQRWPVLLALLGSLGWSAGRRFPVWRSYFLYLTVVLAGYVALVGGDWMGAGRFLVPVLPFFYVVVAAGFATVTADSSASRSASWTGIVVVTMLLAANLLLTSWWGEVESVRADRPLSDSRLLVGAWLRDHAGHDDTLLSNEIGQLAWLSGLYTHDLHGLTDPNIAHLEMKDMGSGKAGHEKINLGYSFSKHPTWVCIPGIEQNYYAWCAKFPPFADYRPLRLPLELPHPEYGSVLRYRHAP